MRRLSAFLISIIATSFATGAEVGDIRGTLVGTNAGWTLSGRPAVFLCDAKSGLPIMPDSRQPLDISNNSDEVAGFDGFWHTIVNDDGSFEFEDVPPGTYRLVAQAWAGNAGVPRGVSSPGDNHRPEPSDKIILYGTAEQVGIRAGETTNADIKPLGVGVQHILCDPEEEHNYVLISTTPPLGDHVLSVAGWDKHFLTGVIGLTRMEVPHLTIIGLPNDKEVHVSLFNYDNNAGVGGVSFVPGEQATVRMPIYAGWSNGKFDPPARLVKLTEHLEQAGTPLENLLPIERGQIRGYFEYLAQHGHDEIDVPGYGPARVVDIAAADSYRSLRKSHAARLERLQQQQPAAK